MWRRIGLRPGKTRTPSPVAVTPSPPSPRGGSTVDCTASNRGLFLGILALVGVIISMIVYFVLVSAPRYADVAVLVLSGAEMTLCLLTLVAITLAAFRIRNMCFVRKLDRSRKLEVALLLVSLSGLLLFCVFSVIAGGVGALTSLPSGLLTLSSALVALQALAQTLFILCALHRSARTVFQAQRKPGREYVTFLLVCNLALWGVYVFEETRMRYSPVAARFYGALPWSVITRLTLPLAILYRFHSSVCLATIWANIYKKNI